MPIKDYTKEFVEMCLNSAKHKDFAPSIGILADRGRGKSCFAFIVITLLLAGNKKRHAKFYQSPPSLLDKIEEAFPRAFSSRFDVIQDVFDIDEDNILAIDEAGNVLNGKKALTKEQREFIEGLTFARHKHVPVLWCTVIPGVSKMLNILSEIKIYKRMNIDYVKALIDDGDKFAKKYSHILTRLPIDRAIFRSNYKYFVDANGEEIREGGLVLNKKEYCPWYSEAISENMSGENMAAERDKVLSSQNALKSFIDEIVEKYGAQLKKGFAAKLIKGFILNEKSAKERLIYMPFVSDITAMAFQKYHEKEQKLLIKKTGNEIRIPEVPELSLDRPNFKSFLDNFYMNNLPDMIQFNQKTSIKKEKIIGILKDWIDGVGQRSLRTDYSISQGNLTQLFKIFKNADGVLQDDLRLCYVYEHWIAKITDGNVFSGVGHPDIIFEINGKKYPGECKLRDNGQNCQSMDIREKLKPSYEYCLKHDIPYFPVFWRDVKWHKYGSIDYYYTVHVDGSFTFNFEQLEQNLLTDFNIEKYFLEQEI